MSTKPSTLTAPWDSGTPPPISNDKLTSTEVTAAMSELSVDTFTKKFRVQEQRHNDSIISDQVIGLFSFIPSKGAKPDEKGVYGFAKLRGNYRTEEDATARARDLVETDSTHTIYHTYVGCPFPVTTDIKQFIGDHDIVNIGNESDVATAEALRGKKADESRRKKELQDRTTELYKDAAAELPQEKIDENEYITQQVKKANLTYVYIDFLRKLQKVKSLIESSRTVCQQLDKDHPEMRESHFDIYKESRVKVGLEVDDEEIRKGFMKYMIEDVELPGLDCFSDEFDSIVSSLPCEEDISGAVISKSDF